MTTTMQTLRFAQESSEDLDPFACKKFAMYDHIYTSSKINKRSIDHCVRCGLDGKKACSNGYVWSLQIFSYE